MTRGTGGVEMSSIEDLAKANRELHGEVARLRAESTDYSSQCLRLRRTLSWLNGELADLQKRLLWTEIGAMVLFFLTVALLYVKGF